MSRPRHVSVCRWPKVHSDEVEMRFFAWLLRWKWWTPRLSPSYLSSQTVHLSRKSKMYSTWVSLTDFLTFLLFRALEYLIWKIVSSEIIASIKVHKFWEDHKILRNLHQLFVLCTASQTISGDFTKFCGLLRIYELYEFLNHLFNINAIF